MFKKQWIITLLLLLVPQTGFADIYEIDPGHTHIGFSIKHMIISNVKGKFNTFSGTAEVDEKDNIKTAVVEIDPASIDTDHEKRDKHLRAPDFLDVKKFPKMTFKYTRTKSRKGNHYVIVGDLTLHGVTKEVELDMELLGKIKDPWGNHRGGVTGTAEIDRRDFGIVWNKLLETGGLVVGNKVKISLEVEAILKK
ncbi:MAG: YceI family protein [Nitrospiria bacterium]